MKPDDSGDRGMLSLSSEMRSAASRFVAAYDSINWDALSTLEVDRVELLFDSTTAKATCASFIHELESACPDVAAFEAEKRHEILANIGIGLGEELEWIAKLERQPGWKPAPRVQKWIAEHGSLEARIRELAKDYKKTCLKLQRERQGIPATYALVAEIRKELFSLLTQLVSLDHARSARFQKLQRNVPAEHRPTAPAAGGVAGPRQEPTGAWTRRQLELECAVTGGARLPQETLETQWIRLSVFFGGYAWWFAKQIAGINTKLARITLPVAGRELLEKYRVVFHGNLLRRFDLPVNEEDQPQEHNALHLEVFSCYGAAGEFVTAVLAGSTADSDSLIPFDARVVGESVKATTDDPGSSPKQASLIGQVVSQVIQTKRVEVNDCKSPSQPGASHLVVIEKDCSVKVDGKSLPGGCQQNTSLLAVYLLGGSEQPCRTFSTLDFVKLCFRNPQKYRSRNFSQRMKALRQINCPELVVAGDWKAKSIGGLRFTCSASPEDIKGFLQTHRSGQDRQD